MTRWSPGWSKLPAAVVAVACVACSMACSVAAAAAGGPFADLLVAYCPTDTTGAGAIVRVDASSGATSIVGTFAWPSTIFGCVLDYDPTYAVDPSRPGVIALDFTDEFGFFIELDSQSAKVARTVTPSDPFFVGYTNMAYRGQNTLVGLTPTVTQSGYCSDGCFQLGSLDLRSHKYAAATTIPFKAAMDDTHTVVGNTFFVQASYDLRDPSQWCVPGHDAATCMLGVDIPTGKLLSAVGPTDYRVDDFADGTNVNSRSGDGATDTTLLAVLEGASQMGCNATEGEFALGRVTLPSGAATKVACVASTAVVHEAAWESAWLAGNSLWLTASGNAEDQAQLLVVDGATGAARINVDLDHVGKDLKAFDGLFEVWAIIPIST